METKITTPVVKGIFITLLLIVFGLIVYFTNQMQNQALNYVQYAIFAGGIVWGCIAYSKQMNANVTFGNVFAHGFKTACVVIVLLTLYTVLAMKVLFPDMMTKGMEIARQKMEQSGKLSDTQIDQQLNFYQQHAVLLTVATIILFFALLGLISALIGAAVAKKKPQDPFTNQPV